MNIIALDTCFDACSVAVQRADGVVFAERRLMHRGHAEALMPMIESTMLAAGLTFSELQRIAVTHGPGSFTGVRVGMAAAIGLAFARSLPIVTYSSLQCMARAGIASLAEQGNSYQGMVVVRDAKRASVYIEITDMSGREITLPALLSVEGARELVSSKFSSATGSGSYGTVGSAITLLAGTDNVVTDDNGTGNAIFSPIEQFDSPDARYMLSDAASRSPTPHPMPLYLRPPDATPSSVPPLARMPRHDRHA